MTLFVVAHNKIQSFGLDKPPNAFNGFHAGITKHPRKPLMQFPY